MFIMTSQISSWCRESDSQQSGLQENRNNYVDN